MTAPRAPEAALFEAVEVIHAAVPGRLRLRVEGLHRHRDLAAELEDRLVEIEGVDRARANPLTGHLLLLFTPELDTERLLRRAAEVAAAAPAGEAPSEPFELPHLPPLAQLGPQVVGWLEELREGVSRGLGRAGRESEQEEVEQPPDRPWHALDLDRIALELELESPEGLTRQAAERRLERYGRNLLPTAKRRSPLLSLADQFRSLPVVLLLGSSVLAISTGGLADAVIILAVVVLNAGIGWATEERADRTIRSLTRVGNPPAFVIRDAEEVELSSDLLVPGDRMLLRRGSRIAADARLTESDELTVDESPLTGESLPVRKQSGPLDAEDVPLADRRSMIYRGTTVVGGSGAAVVTATGPATEIGRIQRLVTEGERPETPMQRQLRHLGRQMAIVTGVVSVAVLGIGVLRGRSLIETLKTAVALSVAAVPEGLPTVATTTLAQGMRTMREHDVLTRRLDSVEALGAVHVVCLDKTGTITENRMRVQRLAVGEQVFDVDGAELRLEGESGDPAAIPEGRRLLEVCALCSEVEWPESGDEEAQLEGSPTEVALVEAAAAAGLDLAALRREYPKLATEHRAEQRRYMTTRHAAGEGRERIAVKGRPDEVLARCGARMVEGDVLVLDEEARRAIVEENERMAGAALRVLAVAEAEVKAGEALGDRDLVWLGLAGMRDPIRPGVPEAIDAFHAAGIRPIMITGDQSATAHAIAKELGLAKDGEQLEMLDSTRLEAIEPELLRGLVRRTHVFSRVDPSHKLRIVEALQASGDVVAMTGDGINDGPALRVADVGIAMGKGAELAREVADVVLKEDNIEGILDTIRQGRAIQDDIRKAVHFITTTNLSEVLFTLTAVAVGQEPPLNAKQLLWINLLTDVFPELALAVEPPEPGLMLRPPRPAGSPLVSLGDYRQVAVESSLMTGATMGAYLYGRVRYGAGAQAGTLGFLTLTATQLLHTITSRSEEHSAFDEGRLPENRWVPLAVGGGFAVELLAELVAGVRQALGTTRIGAVDATVCAACALASFVSNEAIKYQRQHTVWKTLLPERAETSERGDAT